MSLPRIFLLSTIGLFTLIGLVGIAKKSKQKTALPVNHSQVQKIEFKDSSREIVAESSKLKASAETQNDKKRAKKEKASQVAATSQVASALPDANYIDSFFDPAAIKLPIVETITYERRVPWLKGKFAWVSDYASHYKTSKHFIARSLNKKPDYFTQDVKQGDRFNVLRLDKNFHFYLLIDVNLCKMWFYYIDDDTQERTLVKTYQVGLGRNDEKKESGSLTPVGKYSLGEKIAVYKPGTMGYFNNAKTEMVTVFGTRWIPFEEELESCSAPAKGFGLHGAPLSYNSTTGQWEEDLSGIGHFDSDGCIRLKNEEIEELFAIIVSRPTVIELVKNFHEAKLPGKEKKFD